MKKILFFVVFISTFVSCKGLEPLGKCYQNTHNEKCLKAAVNKIKIGVDTAYVKKILGEPIDFGFDYRYLVETTSKNGCPMGAVFHIDEDGKIDQKWFGEICE